MKIKYIVIVVILCAAMTINHFSATSVQNDNTQLYEEKSYIDKANDALKTAVNDDIWYKGENSLLYFFQNSPFEYNIYVGDDGTFNILTTTPLSLDNLNYYYIIKLGSSDGAFTNEIISIHWCCDYENLEKSISSLPVGHGALIVNEVHRPIYSTNTEEKQERLDTIKKTLFSVIDESSNISTLYIRDFYEESVDTQIVYTYNERQYLAFASILGERIYKAKEVIGCEMELYTERIKECSFSMIN